MSSGEAIFQAQGLLMTSCNTLTVLQRFQKKRARVLSHKSWDHFIFVCDKIWLKTVGTEKKYNKRKLQENSRRLQLTKHNLTIILSNRGDLRLGNFDYRLKIEKNNCFSIHSLSVLNNTFCGLLCPFWYSIFLDFQYFRFTNEALPGGGSQVACRNFKMSRVGVLSRVQVAVGNWSTYICNTFC